MAIYTIPEILITMVNQLEHDVKNAMESKNDAIKTEKDDKKKNIDKKCNLLMISSEEEITNHKNETPAYFLNKELKTVFYWDGVNKQIELKTKDNHINKLIGLFSEKTKTASTEQLKVITLRTGHTHDLNLLVSDIKEFVNNINNVGSMFGLVTKMSDLKEILQRVAQAIYGLTIDAPKTRQAAEILNNFLIKVSDMFGKHPDTAFANAEITIPVVDIKANLKTIIGNFSEFIKYKMDVYDYYNQPSEEITPVVVTQAAEPSKTEPKIELPKVESMEPPRVEPKVEKKSLEVNEKTEINQTPSIVLTEAYTKNQSRIDKSKSTAKKFIEKVKDKTKEIKEDVKDKAIELKGELKEKFNRTAKIIDDLDDTNYDYLNKMTEDEFKRNYKDLAEEPKNKNKSSKTKHHKHKSKSHSRSKLENNTHQLDKENQEVKANKIPHSEEPKVNPDIQKSPNENPKFVEKPITPPVTNFDKSMPTNNEIEIGTLKAKLTNLIEIMQDAKTSFTKHLSNFNETEQNHIKPLIAQLEKQIENCWVYKNQLTSGESSIQTINENLEQIPNELHAAASSFSQIRAPEYTIGMFENFLNAIAKLFGSEYKSEETIAFEQRSSTFQKNSQELIENFTSMKKDLNAMKQTNQEPEAQKTQSLSLK